MLYTVKSFLKLVTTAMALCYLSDISAKFNTNSLYVVSVECVFLNPCDLAKNLFLVSKCFLTCMFAIFQNFGQNWQKGNGSIVVITRFCSFMQ